jgi:hypothetical protein
MKLFTHQKACVADLRSLFKKGNKVCLAWYTGAGKTNVFIQWLKEEIESNPKIRIGISAYLTNEIRNQVYDRLKEFGLEDKSQMIVAGIPRDVIKNIVVFNPQSIHRTPLDVQFDILVIDESHAAMSSDCLMLTKIRKNNCTPKTKILLVSATPWDTLAEEDFADVPVLKRPLDQGLQDGLITDFKFYAEEAQIEFKDEDYSRKGDLTNKAIGGHMPVLRSACIGKMHHLIKKYDKALGKKVLVICPPGNYGEVPRTLAQEFDGLPFLQSVSNSGGKGGIAKGRKYYEKAGLIGDVETDGNLEKFRETDCRFLFVIHKCGVGFDMQELDAVVDLTMSRNIRTLAQRIGRVARKNGSKPKSYFYVYDKSLMKDRLEWLISTMIDFALGAYDGWTTKSVKHRKIKVGTAHQKLFPYSTTLSEIVKSIRQPGSIQNQRTLSYVSYNKPTSWTLEKAKERARTYNSRTDMWREQPGLYKWFRLNAKDEMDQIFPIKIKRSYWNRERVIAAMRKCDSRIDFKRKFGGGDYWLDNYCTPEERETLKQKYIGESKSALKWTNETVMERLKTVKKWSEVRYIGNMRKFMNKNGGEGRYKLIWLGFLPERGYEKDELKFLKGQAVVNRLKESKSKPKKQVEEEISISQERKRLQEALAKYRAERAAKQAG